MPKELYENNRVTDTKTSHEVEKFLDKYYTGKIEFVRVTTKSLQFQGVDVIFKSTTGDDMLIDEKCATDYIGKPLETFAFELKASSNKTGQRYDGWLISNKLRTTHYLICYINRAKVNRYPKAEDLQEVEIMLINKEKILSYLENLGWTRDRLLAKCTLIDAGDTTFGDIEDGCKFAKSIHKIESPINILIPRQELRMMALHNDIIRANGS